MTKNNLKITRGMRLLAIALAMIGFLSCNSSDSEKEQFLSRQRDARFFGTWTVLDSETGEGFYDVVYTPEGESYQVRDGKRDSFTEYYYTKGDILYKLFPGDGIKRSSSIHEFIYRFSEDNKSLTLRVHDGYSNIEATLKRKASN